MYMYVSTRFTGVLATANFAKSPAENLDRLRKYQPDKPLMVTEFWSGEWPSFGQLSDRVLVM